MSKKLRPKVLKKRLRMNTLVGTKSNRNKLFSLRKLINNSFEPSDFKKRVKKKVASNIIDEEVIEKINKSSIGGGPDIRGFVKINKIDEDKRMVYGVATTEDLDGQDEVVEWGATKKAVPEFLKWRNLREMHKDSAVGTIPEIEIDEEGKSLNIGAHVVDDAAWKKVKEKVYKGFSIGGKAKERVKEFSKELGKTVSRVKDYVLNEISLVDRPCNPQCTFSMVKRDMKDIDPLLLDVEHMRFKADELEKRVMKDEDIAEQPNSKFGLIKRIKKDGKVVEERYLCMPDKPHAMAVVKQLNSMLFTKREKDKIHARAVAVLGKAHDMINCPYCKSTPTGTGVTKRGGDIIRMKVSKLRKAKLVLDDLLKAAGADEDNEVMEADEDMDIEEENLVPAKKQKRFDASLKDFEGDEEEEEEEMEGEDETVLFDDDEERDDKEELAEDEEGDDEDEDEDEDEEKEEKEEDEGGNCPYCGTTVKALLDGTLKKSKASCPACRTEWDFATASKVRVSKRGGKLRKSAKGGVDTEIGNVLVKLAAVTESIDERLSVLESQPLPRKFNKKNKVKKSDEMKKAMGEEDDDEEMEKAQQLEADIKKAKMLKKKEQSGQTLSIEDNAFCEEVLNKSIDSKFQK